MCANQPTIREKDRSLVGHLWESEKCPYFDLLMFGDGRICSLEINSNEYGDISANLCQFMAATSVSNIENQNDYDYNEGFSTLCSNDYPDSGFTLSGGECCASGENGFVAITSSSSGALVWLAFFTGSNPFNSVSLRDRFVFAQTTSGYIYKFMLSEPQNIEISHI